MVFISVFLDYLANLKRKYPYKRVSHIHLQAV